MLCRLKHLRFASPGLAFTILAVGFAASPAAVADQESTQLQWTTLGTNGGPVGSANRAQPANLLAADESYWLIDAGDGAGDQLARVNVSLLQIDGVVISHLHPDHFGGLAALIARRWFLRSTQPLTIYGPPGIEQLVDGFIAALAPAERVGLGLRHDRLAPAAGTVHVVTVRGGDTFELGDVEVLAIENSHFEPDSDTQSQSLSLRFQRGGYAIGYTGDTGPGRAVEEAFLGVDLLVCEIVDMQSMTEAIDRDFASMPAQQKRAVIEHLQTHHLPPADVVDLALNTGAKNLVVTHIVAAGPVQSIAERLSSEISAAYDGDFTIANDLDSF